MATRNLDDGSSSDKSSEVGVMRVLFLSALLFGCSQTAVTLRVPASLVQKLGAPDRAKVTREAASLIGVQEEIKRAEREIARAQADLNAASSERATAHQELDEARRQLANARAQKSPTVDLFVRAFDAANELQNVMSAKESWAQADVEVAKAVLRAARAQKVRTEAQVQLATADLVYHRCLGEINVEAFRAQRDRLYEAWRNADGEATEARKEVYRRFNLLNEAKSSYAQKRVAMAK
jgi:hypothetical protein